MPCTTEPRKHVSSSWNSGNFEDTLSCDTAVLRKAHLHLIFHSHVVISTPRIVSIFGVSGLQGSSVVDALLRDGTFTPRVLTRNPDSEAGLKLQKRGVEVVAADSGDRASLVEALRGSEAVFAVTVPMIVPAFADGPDELTQGRNMVDAARHAGVKSFIFRFPPE